MLEPSGTKILALIPAYNEERSIAAVVSTARQYLPVLVVDDGSADGTAAAAKAAGAEIHTQKPNQGKGAALLAGFGLALERGFDAVLTLDADGQHDPGEIPVFLQAWQVDQADLIIGQRDFSAMPPVRRASNTLGTWIFSKASGMLIPDNQSGYRLISRRMLAALRAPVEHGFEFEVEMIVRCIQLGYRLEWVPIRTIYGDEKSHISPLNHALKFLQVSWRAWRVLGASRQENTGKEYRGV